LFTSLFLLSLFLDASLLPPPLLPPPPRRSPAVLRSSRPSCRVIAVVALTSSGHGPRTPFSRFLRSHRSHLPSLFIPFTAGPEAARAKTATRPTLSARQ
jgi:hypothetical protein